MIDHIGLHVSDVTRATEFYVKALAPLDHNRDGGLRRRDG
jgi:catechol 2,3-dioxygenase-like lactoylglutathione lyase family enzyme